MRTYIITDIRSRTCQYILYTCAFPCICTNTFLVAYSSVLLSYLIIQYLYLSMCYLVLSFFCHTQVCFLLCYYTYVSTLHMPYCIYILLLHSILSILCTRTHLSVQTCS